MPQVQALKKRIPLPNHNTIISPKKINDVCLLLTGCNCFWDILVKRARKIYTQLLCTAIFNSTATSQGSSFSHNENYFPPPIYIFTHSLCPTTHKKVWVTTPTLTTASLIKVEAFCNCFYPWNIFFQVYMIKVLYSKVTWIDFFFCIVVRISNL